MEKERQMTNGHPTQPITLSQYATTPAGIRPCPQCVVGAYHYRNHRCHLCQALGLWAPKMEYTPEGQS